MYDKTECFGSLNLSLNCHINWLARADESILVTKFRADVNYIIKQLMTFEALDMMCYHIFTVKYVLFTYAIQAQVLCTYRDTISRKLYQVKICQNPYLPREIWTHITPPYHTPNLESCISSKFVKIHISLGRYGLISHPHITPQTSYHISRDPHIRSALFYSIVRCKLFSIYKSSFCI